ncbi:hypothetical protein L4B83_01345 [Streptomyces sp. PSAA01]|nr:hypothetical protein [Streptomyces sp. PSAA01]
MALLDSRGAAALTMRDIAEEPVTDACCTAPGTPQPSPCSSSTPTPPR